jgi:hypothetical protein
LLRMEVSLRLRSIGAKCADPLVKLDEIKYTVSLNLSLFQ